MLRLDYNEPTSVIERQQDHNWRHEIYQFAFHKIRDISQSRPINQI